MAVVVVTGASRGVGAETAVALGARGHDVVVNYREKERRAEKVCALVREAGGRAIAVGADVTTTDGPTRLLDAAVAEFGGIDAVVLNASGGLELGADADYAMRLNRDAQVAAAQAAAERLRPGGRIVFVTSHQAHFSETHPVPAGYEPIAASKLAGERALRALAADEDLDLRVVSGDMIEGTIIVRLLERRDPAAVEERRSHGPLPTVSEFAAAIAGAADSGTPPGRTVYVGGRDLVPGLQG
ncbi:short-chain dehydrogenase [Tsukamurella tyrosinosolvens]|uniref:NAD(P)-dependent dehydrogenase, short-chain alcohol dehydrogenase family n=1 Tax=Tsukamurella tyrosinosolvens TaxID=57704 RepID=A0A1H4M433_TSUTY|nr:SDR family oxidoreductase [Tsukamurella tyrosinosolvens]KXO96788.1 short-chain dehydrogenase [Tsukamurella tyrosinosolvens]SEB77518.1 NAD(P)-dependent dehydrogenase, short-chain alcohol dehydrogenase family [Tsukamurella tyrosinosolvens]